MINLRKKIIVSNIISNYNIIKYRSGFITFSLLSLQISYNSLKHALFELVFINSLCIILSFMRFLVISDQIFLSARIEIKTRNKDLISSMLKKK